MIQIEQLTIKLQDSDEQQAKEMIDRVFQQVAEQLPQQVSSKNIDQLHIRINWNPGISTREMEQYMVEKLLAQLRMV